MPTPTLAPRGLPAEAVKALLRATRAEKDATIRQVGAQLHQLHTLTAPACLGIAAYGYLGDHHPIEPLFHAPTPAEQIG